MQDGGLPQFEKTMKFSMMTQFDPVKPIDEQKSYFSKQRWWTADAWTCPWLILKATRQETEPVRCRCRWGGYWSNMANTTKPSACGSDAALWQITLTSCYYYYY